MKTPPDGKSGDVIQRHYEQVQCDTIDAALEAGSDAPESSNFDEILEAREWAEYRATLIFEELPPQTTRASFVDGLREAFPALAPRRAARIADSVIRARSARIAPQFGPHPTDPFALVPCPELEAEHAQLRRLAINMYLEKRAERPKWPPLSARADCEANVEARRDHLGFPSGTLRTVDYVPGLKHAAPTWLVKGLIPSRGVGMLVGESQSGKSFLAIHVSICVARGIPFFGNKTKPGGVLYIAAEGGSGVLPRINAADEAVGGALPDNHLLRAGTRPMARAPIKVVVETPNLSRDGDTAALARTIRAAARAFEQDGHALALVIVDTWHAALGGADEQAAADTGHALKPFREAVEELGLFSLIVHHPGKDLDRGARGSSSLRGAVDTEIELRVPGRDGSKAKPAEFVRRAQVTKQRDGAVGQEFHYRLSIVHLGVDEDGDAWTTCTVAPCDASELDGGKPGGKGDARFHQAVEAGVAERGGARASMRVVRGYFNNSGPADQTADARRKAWERAIKKGRDDGLIETDDQDEWIWFSNPAVDA